MNYRLTAAVCAVLGFATCALAEDKDSMPLDKAPAAVQMTVKKLIGDAKLESLRKEEEDGKVLYEIEFEVKGADHSATIAEDGKVMEEEAKITAADLPKAVTDAIKAKFPEGKIEDVEEVTKDGKKFYEAAVEVGDDDYEVKIEADGKIMSADKEVKKEDNEEKDEKDEKDEKHEKK